MDRRTLLWIMAGGFVGSPLSSPAEKVRPVSHLSSGLRNTPAP